MSLAPNYGVEPGMTPFHPLTILGRCHRCTDPMQHLDAYTVTWEEVGDDGLVALHVVTHLCETCAHRIAAEHPPLTTTPNPSETPMSASTAAPITLDQADYALLARAAGIYAAAVEDDMLSMSVAVTQTTSPAAVTDLLGRYGTGHPPTEAEPT